MAYVRPIKAGGNRNYVDEVATGYPELPAKELDDDLNVVYNAVNNLAIGIPAIVVMSQTAPDTPTIGQLWFRTDTGRLMIYYDDGSSQQWVPVVPA